MNRITASTKGTAKRRVVSVGFCISRLYRSADDQSKIFYVTRFAAKYCMRYQNLFERTTNSDLLGDLADYILKLLPRVRYDEVERLTLSYYTNEHEFKRIVDRYPQYAKALWNLAHVTVVVDNKTETSTAGAYGARSGHRGGTIVIFCKTLGSEGKPAADPKTLTRMDNGSIRSVKSTLVHELRHFFQRELFPKYYEKRPDADYATDPIEIDAAWFHHLEDFDPTAYTTAAEYAAAVIRAFADYKSLTSYYRRHYFRKAAKYWFERMRGTPDAPPMSLKERNAASKEAQAKAVANMFDSTATSLRDAIPRYDPDAKMFFIRNQWGSALRSAITNQKPIGSSNEGIAYLLLALGSLPDKKLARAVLERLSGKTFEESMQTLPFKNHKGWDANAIEGFIRKRFS